MSKSRRFTQFLCRSLSEIFSRVRSCWTSVLRRHSFHRGVGGRTTISQTALRIVDTLCGTTGKCEARVLPLMRFIAVIPDNSNDDLAVYLNDHLAGSVGA